MKNGLQIVALFLIGIIAALALSGCAATTDQIVAMNYNHAPEDSMIGRRNGAVIVSCLDPAPSTQNNRGEWVVGSLNNAYGVHEADIVANRHQGEWVTEALILELKRVGYLATYKTPLPDDVEFGVQISEIKSFINVDRGIFSSDIEQKLKFNADIIINGNRIKSFSVAANSTKTTPFRASEEENHSVMLQTLQSAMRQVMSEILAQTANK